MANFNITINADSNFSVIPSEVISTDCSSFYEYTITANDLDNIDVSISGSHESEVYILNGVNTPFVDTATGITYNTSLVVQFSIQNSGNAGVFPGANIVITNNTASEDYKDSVQRINDNDKCGANANFIVEADTGASADVILGDVLNIKGGNSLISTIVSKTETQIDLSIDLDFDSSDVFNWNEAFSWGDHSLEGYLKSYTETDPVFLASQAFNISETDIANLSNLSGINSGDQTSILGIAGTKAEFNMSLVDGDFMYIGDAPAAHSLNFHSNVDITDNTSGEILKWDGSAWINNTLTEAGISEIGHTHEFYFNTALDTADDIIEGDTNKFLTVFERDKLNNIVFDGNFTAVGVFTGGVADNSTAIGANTIIDKANQAAIGDASVTELKIGETLVVDKAQIVSQPDGLLVNKNINGKSVVQSNNHILLEKTNTIPKPMIQLGGNGRTDVLTLGQGVTTAFEHTTSNFNAFADASIINMANDDGTGYGSFDVSTRVIGNHSVNHLFGYQCRMEYGSSVPMPFNNTFGSMTTMWSQNRVSTGSAVSTATGFYYQDVVGGGTLSNQYAIVIEPLTKGTNLNWGVFSLADNYLKTVKSDFFRGNGSLITDVDALTLDGLHASSFLRTDVNSQTNSDVKLNLRGAIPGQESSGAALQVNGFIRTGNIFIHSGGINPDNVRSGDYLVNVSGDLCWGKEGLGEGKIWTSANDGPDSGLDADTLDGVQGSSFLRTGNLTANDGNYTMINRDAAFAGQAVLYVNQYGSGGDIARFIRSGTIGSTSSANQVVIDYNANITSSGTITGTNLLGTWQSLNSNQFLRSDIDTVKTGGSLRFQDGLNLRLGTITQANLLSDGSNPILQLSGGDFLIKDISTNRFTFGRTTGNFTNTGAITSQGADNSSFAGNVGIGTTSPSSNLNSSKVLDISSGGNSEIILDHTDGGSGSDIGFVSFERNNDHLGHIRGAHDGSTDSLFLSFHTQAAGGSFFNSSSNERMRISSSGNVGIGTTSPSHKLDVTGTGRFTGDVIVPDEDYGVSWNGSLEVPTKNAIYDKIEALGGVGYSVYRASVTQSGMGVPVAVVFENTLGGAPVWSRDSTGIFYLTLSGVFRSNKTHILTNIGGNTDASWGSTRHLYSNRVSNNIVSVRNIVSGVESDYIHFFIEIKVYP